MIDSVKEAEAVNSGQGFCAKIADGFGESNRKAGRTRWTMSRAAFVLGIFTDAKNDSLPPPLVNPSETIGIVFERACEGEAEALAAASADGGERAGAADSF